MPLLLPITGRMVLYIQQQQMKGMSSASLVFIHKFITDTIYVYNTPYIHEQYSTCIFIQMIMNVTSKNVLT